jgi:hypothetical protein
VGKPLFDKDGKSIWEDQAIVAGAQGIEDTTHNINRKVSDTPSSEIHGGDISAASKPSSTDDAEEKD